MLKYSPQELELKSIQYRRNVLSIIKKANAGHTGGSLSAVDTLNVLYNSAMDVAPQNFQDVDRDHYIQSKGHSVEALYVVLADKGFFTEAELDTLNQYQSHFIGHPTKKVNGIEQNTGALGHGLPIAVGTALAGKMDGRGYRVFTLLGDGELEEGSNWEASMSAAHYGLDNLVVIVDYNKLQITGPIEEVTGVGNLRQKFEAFGYAVREVDGNCVPDLVAVFDQVPFEPGKPNLILAHTTKGKGISFIENQVGWHHHVPTDAEYTIAMNELDAAEKEWWQKMDLGRANLEVFAETLLDLAGEDRDVLAVTGDSRGSGKLGPFGDALPEQIVEVGIAEQNLVGISAGLAAAGKKVFTVSPACFLTARSLEQIKNDVAYSDNPVKLIGISAGVSYGALGTTHHSLHDFAVLQAINNIDIVAPADNFEARSAIEAAVDHPRTLYIRFGKKPMINLHDPDTPFEIGKAITLAEGNDVTFIAIGEAVSPALLAGQLLAEQGLSAGVISMHSLRPLDDEAILEAARRSSSLITVEEHSVFGGLGSTVAALLMENGISIPFKIVGIPDEYTVTGSQQEIFAHYGITPEGLAETAHQLLAKREAVL